MGIELPQEVAAVAKALDVRWPRGDEDKMRAAAKAWRAAGDGVTRLSSETDAVAQHALNATKGDAADAAKRHWNGFVAADTGRMPAIAKGCLQAAQRLEHAATEIAATKTKIIQELLALVRKQEVADLLAREGGAEALASKRSLISGVLANLANLTDQLTGTVALANGTSVETDLHPVTGPGARDGQTGYEIDEATGFLKDPKTGRLIHPESGELLGMPGEYVRNGDGTLVYSNSGEPVDLSKVQLLPRDGALGPDGGASGAPPMAGAPGTEPGAHPDQPGHPGQPGQQQPGLPGDKPVPPGRDAPAPSFGPRPGEHPPPYYDPTPTGPIGGPRPHPEPVYHDPTPTPPMNRGPVNQVGLSFAGAPDPVAAPQVVAPPAVAGPAAPPPGQPPAGFPPFGPGGPTAPPPAAPPPVAAPPAAASHAPVAGAPHAPAAGGAAGVAPVPVPGARAGVGMEGFGPNKDWRGMRPGPGFLEMGAGVAPIVEPDHRVAPPPKISLPGRKDDDLALFLVHLFPLGHMPKPANRPEQQLPRPRAELDYAAGLRFPPHDHPKSALITGYPVAPVPRTPGLAADHPAVLALIPDYDPLGGAHERDWERRFLARPAGDGRPAEYAWPPAELCPEGGVDPDGAEPIVLAVGSLLDRFGGRDGRVFAVDGTPFTERGLPPEMLGHGYHRFRVARELPVWRTVAAPWFGQAGGGVRFRTTHAAAELVALGFLVEVGEDGNG